MYALCSSFLGRLGTKEFFRETDPDDGHRENSARGVMGIHSRLGSEASRSRLSNWVKKWYWNLHLCECSVAWMRKLFPRKLKYPSASVTAQWPPRIIEVELILIQHRSAPLTGCHAGEGVRKENECAGKLLSDSVKLANGEAARGSFEVKTPTSKFWPASRLMMLGMHVECHDCLPRPSISASSEVR